MIPNLSTLDLASDSEFAYTIHLFDSSMPVLTEQEYFFIIVCLNLNDYQI